MTRHDPADSGARRRRTDEAWTVGDHEDYEDRVERRLDQLERQLDRIMGGLVVIGLVGASFAGTLVTLLLTGVASQ